MLHALKVKRMWVVAAAALAAGFVGAKFMVQGSPIVNLPWGVLAFLSAFIAGSKKQSLGLGGLFGFVASYAYLWFDDTSKLTPTGAVKLALVIFLPALFGLACGLLAAWAGWMVRQKLCQG